MNRILFAAFFLFGVCYLVKTEAQSTITIETKGVGLHYTVGKNNKVYQKYVGAKLQDKLDYEKIALKEHEIYMPFGTNNLFESAIRTVHNDGNPSITVR